uniref:Uncharacterized protein n=1 Tax=Strigamia maritima TaxID=126957 RepID=T1JHG1_STRMM
MLGFIQPTVSLRTDFKYAKPKILDGLESDMINVPEFIAKKSGVAYTVCVWSHHKHITVKKFDSKDSVYAYPVG